MLSLHHSAREGRLAIAIEKGDRRHIERAITRKGQKKNFTFNLEVVIKILPLQSQLKRRETRKVTICKDCRYKAEARCGCDKVL